MLSDMLANLDRRNLEAMDPGQRDSVLCDAGAKLTAYFSNVAAVDFESRAEAVVDELERLGHNLRLFDAGFDLEDINDDSLMWTGNWEAPKSTRLIIAFHSRDGVELMWTIVDG